MNPFRTHTGRALPLRCGSVGTEQILLATAARRGGYGGATILICGPDCEIGAVLPAGPVLPAGTVLPARVLAGYGFRAVISARFGDILYNDMIQAGIAPARLRDNAVDKLLCAVEADPRIPIAIDLGRREVTARGGPPAAFEIDECARQALIDEYTRQALMAGTDALADRLLTAQRSLASCDLAADLRIRLQRRLMAICDAMKGPDADADRGRRRLEKFFEDLDRRR